MPRIRPIEDEFLDDLIVAAEQAFARAARRAFNVAAGTLRMTVTASAGDPTAAEAFVSIDDAAIASQAWKDQIPQLVADIRVAFEASAYGTVNAIGEAVLPPIAQVGLTIPPVVDSIAVDHLATATNRITKFGDQMWGAVRNELLQGFQAGESIDDLASRVSQASSVTQQRARTIARTEVISASNAGAYTAAQAMPNSLKPKLKEWLAAGDSRTRETHAAADGQQVELDKPFHVGRARLRYPGDPSGPADEIVNCRCTVLMDVEPVHVQCATNSLVASGDEGDVSSYRAMRLQLGLSRKEMAEKMGMSIYQLDLIELGKREATPQEQAKFSLIPGARKSLSAVNAAPAPPKVTALPGADIIGSCAVSKKASTPAPVPMPPPVLKVEGVRTLKKDEMQAAINDMRRQYGRDGKTASPAVASRRTEQLGGAGKFSNADIEKSWRRYTGSGYAEINDCMRGGCKDPALKSEIQNLKKAFTPPPARPLETDVVFRGMEGDNFGRTLQVGTTFQDKAFVSTTDDFVTAHDFAGAKQTGFATNGRDDKTLFVIKPNATTRQTPVLAGVDHESEWILPPGSTFRVEAIDEYVSQVGGTRRIVHVTWES